MADTKPNGRADVVTYSGIKGVITFWLPIIAIAITLVVGWVTMGRDIQQVKADQIEYQNKYDAHILDVAEVRATRDQQYLEIQLVLTAMQKDILYIRQQLDKHVGDTP